MNKDKLGIFLSVGCIAHCILTPLVLPVLPLVGFSFEHSGLIHVVLSILVVLVATVSIGLGARKYPSRLPVGLTVIGSFCLFYAGLTETIDGAGFLSTAETIVGSVSIITAHYLNHKNLCSCKHHHATK